MPEVDKLITSYQIKYLISNYIKKLMVDQEVVSPHKIELILDFVQSKSKTRGLGLLYYVLIDLYIDHLALDNFAANLMTFSKNKCFWERCLNIAVVGFETKNSVTVFNKVFKQPVVMLTLGIRGGYQSKKCPVHVMVEY